MNVSLSQQLIDLREGRAALELTGSRVIEVTGADAIDWLDALVTTGVARMESGEARASFLLQPTGRIRATFTVVRMSDGALLIQPPGEPTPIDSLLAIYRLSSDVTLTPLDETVFLVAGDSPGLRDSSHTWLARSTEGSRLLGSSADEWLVASPRAAADHLRATLSTDRTIVEDSPDLWVAMGRPRFPTDLTPDALPLEASEQLGDSIDHDKGCYLGQEAIAKTRNFGRTPFIVRTFRTDNAVAPGDAVNADGAEVGEVTSSTAEGDGFAVIARIRARAEGAASITTIDGRPLDPVHTS